MSRWKLAIFDWNGTLFDDLGVLHRMIDVVFTHYNIPIPPLEVYRGFVNPSILDFYYAHGLPQKITRKEIGPIHEAVIENYRSLADLRPGARELLDYCFKHGMQRTLVSGEQEKRLKRRLEECVISHFFDLDHIWPEARDKKVALQEALDWAGVSAEEAFYVDDTFYGNKSARALGITTFGLANITSYNLPEIVLLAGSTHVVLSLQEVLDILKEGDKA